MERIKLDLIPKGITPICHASQYDDGRVIRLDLMEGLQGYVLSDETIVLNVRKPDNTVIAEEPVTVIPDNTFVDIVTTEQMTAVVGDNLCELKITKDSAVIGTLNFVMKVERDVLADGIESESVIRDLDTLAKEAIDAYLMPLLPTDSASGSIATFPDGADDMPLKSLKVEIEPIQSGSGTPYPAGGGKNKYPIPVGDDTFSNNGGAIHSNDNGALKIVCNGANNFEGVYGSDNTAIVGTARNLGFPCTISMDIWGSASGSARVVVLNNGITETIGTTKKRISITVNSDATSGLFNCYGQTYTGSIYVDNVQIEAGSTATDYAPYSNIRPITGSSVAEVTRTGKNLLPHKVYQYQAGRVNLGIDYRDMYYLPLEAGTYKFTAVLQSQAKLFYKEINDTSSTQVGDYTGTPLTINIAQKGLYTFWLYKSGGYPASDVTSFMLEKGTTATPYEEYTEVKITIPFGQEVYGGYWKDGKLTIDRWTFDLGSNVTYTQGATGRVDLTKDRIEAITGYNPVRDNTSELLCSALPVTQTANQVRFSTDVLAGDFATTFAGETLCYKLATPIEISISAEQLNTLLGTNNIFADTGDVECEYYADIALYIQKKIAEA